MEVEDEGVHRRDKRQSGKGHGSNDIAAMEKRNQTPPPVDVVAASLNKDNVSLLTGS